MARAETKDDRFNFRWSAAERRAVERAALEIGMSASDFVRDSAYVAAQRILADRTVFHVDERRWKAFVDALDRPAESKPRLRKLLREPSVIERGERVSRRA